jgi:hypothetical protein
VRPHLLLFVLLLRHPRLQLMRKQWAAWGLAMSLATSSSASATPPKRGTRHQWCRCWHKMYQAMLSSGTPTLAAVAALTFVRHRDGRRRGGKPGPSIWPSDRAAWEGGAPAAQPCTSRRTGLGGGGSTLKTARPGQGEPNPAMEATDPITRRRIWGRTGAWHPTVLLLKSDGQILRRCSKPSRGST